MPTTSYGLTHAAHAFRDISQARHSGKIVLITPPVFDPDAMVVITGGTGLLGGVFAEHLITRYGVRHLRLVSRRGRTPGATELQQHLAGLGGQVSIAACDTSDPAALAALLETLPQGRRLGSVIHAAGVLDDAVVTELSAAQLDAGSTAKADTAWHLHRLTADRSGRVYLFSSAAGVTLGAPGQANYAAANAFLDALAHHRHPVNCPRSVWPGATGKPPPG